MVYGLWDGLVAIRETANKELIRTDRELIVSSMADLVSLLRSCLAFSLLVMRTIISRLGRASDKEVTLLPVSRVTPARD